MAELMRRPSSLFHFFDFYQRLHVRKTLSYRRQGRANGRTKLPKSKLSPSVVKEEDMSDTKTNLLMEDEVHTSKGSTKGRMVTLISKLYKKKDRKKKISPLASQLLRTISIHHLECNDYVISEEMTSDIETSMTDLDSHENSPLSNKHVISWPTDSIVDDHYPDVRSSKKEAFVIEAINKVKGSLLKWKSADAALLSKRLDLFEADEELFLRFLEDPSTILENYGLPQQGSSPEIVLTKSHSFPRTGLSASRNRKVSNPKRKGGGSFVNQEVETQTASSASVLLTSNSNPQDEASVNPNVETSDSVGMLSSFELPGSPREMKDQRDHATVLNRFKVLKERIKDVIRDNNRISKDGFLHKIPYGQKVPEIADKEKLRLYDGPASDKYDTDRTRSKLGGDGSVLANNKYSRRRIQRSPSLTESLDKYSKLIESMSLGEPRRPLERLKSIQEHDRKSSTPKTWGRMLSSPQFGTYDFSKIIYDELSDTPGSPKISASSLLVSDAAIDIHLSSHVHTEKNQEADRFLDPTRTDRGQQVTVDEHEQREPCEAPNDSSVDQISCVPPCEHEASIEAGSHEKLMRPSSISVLDSSCQEESISPVKYSVTQGSDIKPGWTTFDELAPHANCISDEVEIVKAGLNNVQMPINFPNIDLLGIQVDPKDELEFEFVSDILKKYEAGGENFLEGAVDGSRYELSITGDVYEDMSVDDLLLVDLVNEILLEIDERSSSRVSSLSWLGSQISLKPMRNHLREVWAKTSWHLSFQRHPNRTFDDILGRDFAKYDRWMNLRMDSVCVGLELEGVILDELLDEVMLDFGD